MPDSFETGYDGKHHVSDPTGSDWRTNPLERLASYGNFAGPGNRNDAEHRATDPAQRNGPIDFKPIDGMDAAAERHDKGYEALDGHSMWSWGGISRVAGADRRLADETDQEMAKNGSKYSPEAERYSRAMRGIFGGRASVVEGANWAGEKAHEAGQGIGNFVDSAKDWHSVGDAGRGIGNGVVSGAKWLGNTASQGWNGIKDTASYFNGLGTAGKLGAAFGAGEAALAGGAHLVGEGASAAWNGAKSVGQGIANGASTAAHFVGDAAASGAHLVGQGASAAWNGAKSVGQGIANGASTAAHYVGDAAASGAQLVGQGASAAWNGAKSVGSSVASGVSSVAHAAGDVVSSGASAVTNGAKAVGGAVASGASKAWNWLTH